MNMYSISRQHSRLILCSLLKSPSTTSPLLKEALRIIPQPSLKRILPRLRPDPAPVILAEISIIHKQWSIHIREKSLVDILLYQIAHSQVQVLVCLVDSLVVHRERVGEV